MSDFDFSFLLSTTTESNLMVTDTSNWIKCEHLKLMKTVVDYEFILKDSDVCVLTSSPQNDLIYAVCLKTQIPLVIPLWAVRLVKEELNQNNPWLKLIFPNSDDNSASNQVPPLTPLSPSTTNSTILSPKLENTALSSSEDEHVIRPEKKTRKRNPVWDKKYDAERKKKGKRGHGVNLLWDQRSKCTTPYPENIDRLMHLLLNYKPNSVAPETAGVATFTATAVQNAKQTIKTFNSKSWRVWLPDAVWARFSLLKAVCTPQGMLDDSGTTSIEFAQMLIQLGELTADGLVEVTGFVDFQQTPTETTNLILNSQATQSIHLPTAGSSSSSSLNSHSSQQKKNLTVANPLFQPNSNENFPLFNFSDPAFNSISQSDNENCDFDQIILNSSTNINMQGTNSILHNNNLDANAFLNTDAFSPTLTNSSFMSNRTNNNNFLPSPVLSQPALSPMPTNYSSMSAPTSPLPANYFQNNAIFPNSQLPVNYAQSSTATQQTLPNQYLYTPSYNSQSNLQHPYSPSQSSSIYGESSTENVEIKMHGKTTVIPAAQLSEALAYIQQQNSKNQVGNGEGLVTGIQGFLNSVPYNANPVNNNTLNNAIIYKVNSDVDDVASEALVAIKNEKETIHSDKSKLQMDNEEEDDPATQKAKLLSLQDQEIPPYSENDHPVNYSQSTTTSQKINFVKASEFVPGAVVNLTDIQRQCDTSEKNTNTSDSSKWFDSNIDNRLKTFEERVEKAKPNTVKKESNYIEDLLSKSNLTGIFDEDNINKKLNERSMTAGVESKRETNIERLVKNEIEQEQLAEVLKYIPGLGKLRDLGKLKDIGNLKDLEITVKGLGKTIEGLGKSLEGLSSESSKVQLRHHPRHHHTQKLNGKFSVPLPPGPSSSNDSFVLHDFNTPGPLEPPSPPGPPRPPAPPGAWPYSSLIPNEDGSFSTPQGPDGFGAWPFSSLIPNEDGSFPPPPGNTAWHSIPSNNGRRCNRNNMNAWKAEKNAFKLEMKSKKLQNKALLQKEKQNKQRVKQKTHYSSQNGLAPEGTDEPPPYDEANVDVEVATEALSNVTLESSVNDKGKNTARTSTYTTSFSSKNVTPSKSENHEPDCSIQEKEREKAFKSWWEAGQDLMTLIELFKLSSENFKKSHLTILISCYLTQKKKISGYDTEILAESLTVLIKQDYIKSSDVWDSILNKNNFDIINTEEEGLNENLANLLKVLVVKGVISIKEVIEKGISFGGEFGEDGDEDYDEEDEDSLVDVNYCEEDEFDDAEAEKLLEIKLSKDKFEDPLNVNTNNLISCKDSELDLKSEKAVPAENNTVSEIAADIPIESSNGQKDESPSNNDIVANPKDIKAPESAKKPPLISIKWGSYVFEW
ncbi:hypothetical protein HDU92_002583 [Lobulomyces angularis]|nr:hypothetical protein HDU92_002583 [Lobulomyces angularis]